MSDGGAHLQPQNKSRRVAQGAAAASMASVCPLCFCKAPLTGWPCCPLPQFSFSLNFGFSGLFGSESLRLCFDTEEQAQEWHSQLAAAIRRMERLGSGGEHPLCTSTRLATCTTAQLASRNVAGNGAALLSSLF